EAGARFCGSCGKKVDVAVDPPVSGLDETAAGTPQAPRRGDISGTIRPLSRSEAKPDSGRNVGVGVGRGNLESAAMTLFQSAKSGAGAGPAPAVAAPAPIVSNPT